MSLRAHGLLPRDFLVIRLDKSLRNVRKTHYTSYICRIIQDQPSYHDIFLPCDFPPNGNDTFELFQFSVFHFTELVFKFYGLYKLSYFPANTLFFDFSFTLSSQAASQTEEQ
jgi:hypothetical protein